MKKEHKILDIFKYIAHLILVTPENEFINIILDEEQESY